MTARPDLPSGGSSAPAATPRPTSTDRPSGAPLRAAIAVAVVGALLVSLGPLLGLVDPGAPAAFPAWPMSLVLALLAPALAVLFTRRGRPTTAAAALIGPAVLVPGRLLQDLQFVVDPSLAARPDLLHINTLDTYGPSIGVWLLLAGHIAVAGAGLLAVRGLEPAGSEAESGARRQGLLALVFCAGVVAAVGVLMAPFGSDDPYLLPRSAVDSPVMVLVGSLLLAVGVPSAAGFAAGSSDPDFARGGLLGVAAALAGVVVPPLVAVAVVPGLHFGWGPALGLVAIVALAVLAVPAGRVHLGGQEDDLRLPALTRLLALTAGFALVAGVLAIVAAIAPRLRMPFYLRDPSPYPARLLWPAGLLLVLLGAGLLVRRVAPWLRPMLPVVCAVVPFAAAGVLDAVFTALQVTGAQAGIGAWAAGFAVLFAVFAAVTAALAGGVERDDVDLTEIAMSRRVLVPALLALVLGAGAFAFPVVTGPGYTPPGVFASFGTTSWGLVIALLAVVGAAVLAPMCRPPRAVALLCGAALVVAVRVLEFPLTAGRIDGSAPGIGVWLGAAGIVALLGTAALAGRTR
ncbi:hypothetical protein [Saccharopolyspora rosea]|uniref:hypothetical protein n=1 Tax=Saccharopolyspora rosea TaxID=524884 RepID=UPI0021DA2B42|nr:hypothetical protein [Saccharopolyspora rosea]